MRLGIYADLVYRRDGDVVSTDRAFIRFVAGLSERTDELVFFGRLAPQAERAPYALPAGNVRFVAFPYYPNVADLRGLARSLAGAVRVFSRELDRLDAVWLFGPHPISLVLALVALARRKRVFLGVRQDSPEYVRSRLRGRRWAWALPAARAFEWIWRRMSRVAPAVVVGDALGRAYTRSGGRALPTLFTLVRADDVVDEVEALARPWTGALVTVGRIDREKNPLLLPDILARLRATDDRWRLTVVGTGPMERALVERARELGVDDALELAGYVPAGDGLWSLYRAANAFLHVSFTEGVPQVLVEAQAAGTPVVATDVGGVREGLEGGRGALLVPADEAASAVAALERVRDDDALRERLVQEGLDHARRETMDAALDRIAAYFADQGDQPSPRARDVRA